VVQPPPDFPELIARLRNGDYEALAILCNHYRADLRRVVERRVYDQKVRRGFDASDVVQAAVIDAHQGLQGFLKNFRPEDVYYWLHRLVDQQAQKFANRELAQKRTVRRQEPIPGSSTHPAADLSTPSEAVVRDERIRRFWQAMERLDPLDREIICLRRIENLPNNEVARTTGLTDGGATKRLQRAEERLADIIRGLLDSKESML
jgi:RNA polymerase sigma factor (sigma-70 family)